MPNEQMYGPFASSLRAAHPDAVVREVELQGTHGLVIKDQSGGYLGLLCGETVAAVVTRDPVETPEEAVEQLQAADAEIERQKREGGPIEDLAQKIKGQLEEQLNDTE